MIVYIIFLILLLMGFLIKKKTSKKVYFLTLFCLLFSLRSIQVGVDIDGYVTEFLNIARTDWNHLFAETTTFYGYEKGFIVFDKLVSYITKDANFYLFICATIIYGSLIYFFSFISENDLTKQTIMFVCLPSFAVLLSGLRQAFAVSFVLLAYVMFKKRKYLISLLLYALAITFHATAFLGILLLFTRIIKIEKKHVLTLFVVGIIVFLTRTVIAKSVFEKIEQFSDKMEFYPIEDNNSYTMILFYLIILFILFWLSNSVTEKNRDFLEYRNIVYILMLLQLFASIQTNLMRTTYYFLPFLPMAIITVVEDGKLKFQRKYVYLVLFIGLFILYFYFIAGSSQMELVPYKFFWE